MLNKITIWVVVFISSVSCAAIDERRVIDKKDVDFVTPLVAFGWASVEAIKADDYKRCIMGTQENNLLSDSEQIGCEEVLSPDAGTNEKVNPLLATEINSYFGASYDFFAESNIIHFIGLDKDSSIKLYLWPTNPDYSPLEQDTVLDVRLSVINEETNTIYSKSVILYEFAAKQDSIKYLYDYDLFYDKNRQLVLQLYTYQDPYSGRSQRILTESFTIGVFIKR